MTSTRPCANRTRSKCGMIDESAAQGFSKSGGDFLSLYGKLAGCCGAVLIQTSLRFILLAHLVSELPISFRA